MSLNYKIDRKPHKKNQAFPNIKLIFKSRLFLWNYSITNKGLISYTSKNVTYYRTKKYHLPTSKKPYNILNLVDGF